MRPEEFPALRRGPWGGARDREGAAVLPAHILPTARTGGGKQPRLTDGGYAEAPEPGRHISQSDGRVRVLRVSLPRAGAGTAPGNFAPLCRGHPGGGSSLPKIPGASLVLSATGV